MRSCVDGGIAVKKIILLFILAVPLLLHAEETDYRQRMRDFVMELRVRADELCDDFIIIPQNGQEVVTGSGDSDGTLMRDYLSAVDGCGREDLFFGYEDDDRPTPYRERQHLFELCRLFAGAGKTVLVTDYCSSPANIDESYLRNAQSGFISFAADSRELDKIPDYPASPYKAGRHDVNKLAEAGNFLYILNSGDYDSPAAFISELAGTDYDLIIMDLFHDGRSWTRAEIERLRLKANGGRRLLVCYMSIGEAESYRWYWRPGWTVSPPSWLAGENPDWEGNFKVRYWDEDWKGIIFRRSGSYLEKVIAAGFDGVYLDIIDAFEYFEN